MMEIKSKIKEEYIFISAIAVISGLILLSLFKADLPNLKRYISFKKEAADKERELNIRKSTVQQIASLNKEITRIDQDYKDFTRKVILQPGSFEAVRVITDIAEGLKIEYLSIQPLPTQKIELYNRKDEAFMKFLEKEKKEFFLWEMPVAVKIKGSYPKTLNFIKRIENNQRFLKIKKVQIAKDKDTPLMHNTDLVISMFSMPQMEK